MYLEKRVDEFVYQSKYIITVFAPWGKSLVLESW